MHVIMGVPLRVATATSNLMIGITASASAIIYLLRGGIDPYAAAPTAIGVFIGASIGSRIAAADRPPDPPRPVRRDPALHCVADAAASNRMTASIPGGLSAAATGAESATRPAGVRRSPGLERTIARLLTSGTYARDRSARRRRRSSWRSTASRPLSGGPGLRSRPASSATSSRSGRPAFLWLGLARRHRDAVGPGRRVAGRLRPARRAGDGRRRGPDPPRDRRRASPSPRAWRADVDILILVGAFIVILLGRRAVHERDRVVRAQARARRGRRRLGPRGGRDRPARDDDPDHRDPVRRRIVVVARDRRRGDPRRAVHALDPGDVRDRRRGPVRRAGSGRAATTCRSTRRSSPTTCATSRSPTRSRSRAAFLPLDPAWPKWIVAVVLIGIYGWYVQGPLRGRPERRRSSDLPPLRFNRLDPATPNGAGVVPRLRVVNLQVLAALGLIVLGAFFFVDAVEHLSSSLGHRADHPRPRHRPDRDRAAREVQLGDLGPPGQGHPRDGQHHRGDGLPVDDPDGRRAALRRRRLALQRRTAGSRSPRPPSRSWRRR